MGLEFPKDIHCSGEGMVARVFRGWLHCAVMNHDSANLQITPPETVAQKFPKMEYFPVINLIVAYCPLNQVPNMALSYIYNFFEITFCFCFLRQDISMQCDIP